MQKKKSWMSLLNPLEWLNTALALLAAVFTPILRWLGILNPPSTDGFQNLTKEDVCDAAKLAQEQEAAVDTIAREMPPAEVVHAYAKANADCRATMDLSALDITQQDWLLRLSDEDLGKLAMSTSSGCARSLEALRVLPRYPRQQELETIEIPRPQTEEEIEEMKRRQIAALFRQAQKELFHAPGVPNLDPKHIAATLH